MMPAKKIHHDYYKVMKQFIDTYTSIHQLIYCVTQIYGIQDYTEWNVCIYSLAQLLYDVVNNKQIKNKNHKV
jgi:hypothetical protein